MERTVEELHRLLLLSLSSNMTFLRTFLLLTVRVQTGNLVSLVLDSTFGPLPKGNREGVNDSEESENMSCCSC